MDAGMTPITALHFASPLESYLDGDGAGLAIMDGLSRVNIIVGPNNAGKSRLLRAVGTTVPSALSLDLPALVEAQRQIDNVMDPIETLLERFENLPTLVPFAYGKDSIARLRVRFEKYASYRSQLGGRSYVAELAQPVAAKLATLKSPEYPTKRIYIPVLRGLRPFKGETDVYKERTQRDYFSEAATEIEVTTGLDLYDKVKSLLLGDYDARQKIAKYERFLSHTFFEDQLVSLIPRESDDVLYIKIGDEKEQPVYLLGDGLQSLIIITFPMFFHDSAIFCIEEPELYLHPGMQKRLLDIFAAQERHMFFATTHSNHFLDMSMDTTVMSIYRVSKNLPEGAGREHLPTFRVEQVNRGDRSVLAALGVRDSSVFLVNATIWVEGITDRWYFRKFLELYQAEQLQQDPNHRRMEEGTHFAFVEYGGANITHWSFLDEEDHPIGIDTLCGRALLISDRDGDSKLERKTKLEQFLGERYICLDVREVENLLPPRVIKALIRKYEKNPSLELRDFEHADYADKYLGTFIADDLREGASKRSYKAKSGTIKQKRKFCQDALDIFTRDDLHEPIRTLAERVYNFIAEHNGAA